MKGFVQKGAVIVIAGMFLTGCGEQLKVLTESEEAAIVNYSAGTLSKFNQQQEDGITVVVLPDEQEAVEDEKKEPVAQQPQENVGTEENPAPQEPGTQKPEETGITLTEAFAVAGISAGYVNYEIMDNFEQGDYVSMVASEGKTYLILNFNLVNTSTEAVLLDNLGRKSIFTVVLNGKSGVRNEMTILPNDLSTFVAAVEPGATIATVLVFQVPKEDAVISTMELSLQIDGNSTKIIIP